MSLREEISAILDAAGIRHALIGALAPPFSAVLAFALALMTTFSRLSASSYASIKTWLPTTWSGYNSSISSPPSWAVL